MNVSRRKVEQAFLQTETERDGAEQKRYKKEIKRSKPLRQTAQRSEHNFLAVNTWNFRRGEIPFIHKSPVVTASSTMVDF